MIAPWLLQLPRRQILAFAMATAALHLAAFSWLTALQSNTESRIVKESKVQIKLLKLDQPPAENKIAENKTNARPAASDSKKTVQKTQKLTPAVPPRIADNNDDSAIYQSASGYLAVTPTLKPDPDVPFAKTETETSASIPTANTEATNAVLEKNTGASKAIDPDTPNLAQFTSSPLPSAQLKLQLIRTEPNKNPYYGVGEINWQLAGDRYTMTIDAGLDLLLTTLNLFKLKSEGKISQAGLTPITSSETRRNRSETATHFNHADNLLSFSSSNKTQTMAHAAQDKASVLMQLAGIGYADPTQFKVGREIIIQVAEEREATIFRFIIAGQEELSTKLGTLMTWHIVRPPRAGSYNSQLDIWFAPGMNWYPVQIRNTETNGAITTQIVTSILHPAVIER
ncbi:DUF3108 domain-containing protein [Undibacterium sp. Jales W-56]|uniref:DUF3108 domain-containing protein n=1 Tax=Undibacterium sp. Jales W-56 TaxID=2897325 RepID=UPI0021D3CCC6|nr:DUF3108 domain-containing protein [Undibacterium sp. Jales W-56]MCU6435017.1 DUF3108 domain-containing protein [Undibacterium sp. Jales W-56]